MKKILSLSFTLLTAISLNAQVCTTSGFDDCDAGTGVVSDFRNAVQITGTGSPLTVGAKYKFNNAIPSLNLDAVISIDAMVNATMAGAVNPSIDDDGAADETGTPSSQVALFAPRIAPNQILSCTNQSGYVEFTVKFYSHYSGNGAPAPGTEMAVSNLNFLHFDMDGSMQGSDGWFKEIGYAKVNGADPVNYGAAASELFSSNNNNGWLLTTGSTNERNGVSRCSEVIEKSVYILPQSSITFRMGYDYKAPSANCGSISIQPARQYGSRFGCFNLPAGGPLPVSLINLAANYNAGKSNITWTSLQEHNLDSYEIQRSYDGINFEVAGNVKANNLTSLQQYKFTDNLPAFTSKYIYYRVRVVDIDHSMKLTNTVSIKIADWKTNEMVISPNPSSSGAQIKIKTIKTATGDISVFDATGKLVLKQQATLLAGSNTVVLNNITLLPEGYYTVRLIAGNETFSSKLLIWK
jgi:hypothetical protein